LAVEPVGPDEELVAGRRPVEEAFAARRPAIRLLVTPQRRAALERIVLHATNLRIPIVEVEGGTLTALATFDGHQGVALVVAARRYATVDEVLARAIERDEPPFVLALDSLEDPQNVGTLLRSAEAAGVHGVLFPTRRQAPLTPAAVKASSGAVEHLLLVPVDDLAGALTDLHVRGLRIVGAEAHASLTARQADLRGPLALVVGSEGQGLGPAVRRRCDLVVRIPMRGAIGSLNAAVAGSILLFEALAQRDPEATAGATSESTSPAADGPSELGQAAKQAAAVSPKQAVAARKRPAGADADRQAEPAAAPDSAPSPASAPPSGPAVAPAKPAASPMPAPSAKPARSAKTARSAKIAPSADPTAADPVDGGDDLLPSGPSSAGPEAS
jgi:23S rRNA (guanosine2251-2'-O)-methyltransferase